MKIPTMLSCCIRNYSFVLIVLCCILLQSCYTTQNETFYVSVVNDLKNQYVGKSKTYIIENFIYPITDIKHLDNQYEILICERYRPLGKGVTRFFIKNGICYNIETNEYKAEQQQVKVSLF